MGASSILTAVRAVRTETVYEGPIFVFSFVACRNEEDAGMRRAFMVDCDAVRGSAARLSITRNADWDWFVPLFLGVRCGLIAGNMRGYEVMNVCVVLSERYKIVRELIVRRH